MLLSLSVLAPRTGNPFTPLNMPRIQAPEIILGISQNASVIVQNQTLQITMTLKNVLPFPVDLPYSGRLPLTDMTSGSCGQFLPFGFVVHNSTGSALPQFSIDGFGVACPVFLERSSFHFEPFQSITRIFSLTGYRVNQYYPNYWVLGILDPFPPGKYVFLVGDIWGHTASASFTVVAV